MKDKKITDYSNEELLITEKRMKGIAIGFATILTFLLAAVIFSIIKKGYTSIVVTPIALFPLLIIIMKNWNELKKEIKSRNL